MVVEVKYYAKNIPYEEIEKYTNCFCEENHIGDSEFGKFYRGDLPRNPFDPPHVTVKFWDISKTDTNHRDYVFRKMMAEFLLLQNEFILSHPTMAKLYGYCLEEEHIGVMYDFEPVDTVYNLLPKDEFSWLQRMKVAVRIASLFTFFHDQENGDMKEPFLVNKLDASHLVLDKDGNPKLCDFSMITGGILPYSTSQSVNDGSTHSTNDLNGGLTAKTDVYEFGGLLLNLMTKRVCTDEERRSFLCSYSEWTQEEQKISKVDMGIKKPKFSLLHKSFETDPYFCISDGPEITMLAMKCMKDHPHDRPTMEEVVDCLKSLEIFQRHPDYLRLEPNAA